MLRKILKKNLEKIVQTNPAKLVLFFDEARFGTHSKLGHGWFYKGTRPSVKIKIGFKNFYVYSAVAPFLGEHFTLVMPEVNTTCFNIFLEHLAKECVSKELLLVMDCAGWHKSKNLVIPPNIQIVYLPPYSPELNPVERLWQHIKRWTLRNKIYETVELLEDVVCDFIAKLLPERVKTTCSVNYLFT